MPEKTSLRTIILMTTLKLIAEQGFHGTSVQMIASKAGVGMGSIYRYFKSKDDLIHALYDYVDQKIRASVRISPQDDLDLKAQYAYLCDKLVSYYMNAKNEFIFTDRYFSSPYGFSKKKEILLGGSAASSEFGVSFEFVFENGKRDGVIKNLPLWMLYMISMPPLISMVKDCHSGVLEFDQLSIEKVIEATWDAIKK